MPLQTSDISEDASPETGGFRGKARRGQGVHVVVHIPKTGGTSLRYALAKRSDRIFLIFDYGPQSPVTHPALRHGRSRWQSVSSVVEAEAVGRIPVVMGHFPASRYVKLAPPERFATFLRHPAQRLLSAYNHFRTHKGLTQEFADYVETSAAEVMARYLRGFHLEAMGFVGLTESYALDLPRFSEFIGVELDSLNVNTGNYGSSSSRLSIPDEIAARIRERIPADFDLYDKARRLVADAQAAFAERRGPSRERPFDFLSKATDHLTRWLGTRVRRS